MHAVSLRNIAHFWAWVSLANPYDQLAKPLLPSKKLAAEPVDLQYYAVDGLTRANFVREDKKIVPS